MLIAFIIYIVATKGTSATFNFLAFGMAMGNTYGVVLIILLMGNGLVALPRRLWRMGNSKNEMDRIYLMVYFTKMRIICIYKKIALIFVFFLCCGHTL
jgi:hypothetical protein